MASKIDIAGTKISASQMSEFFRLAALPESHINRTTFQEYLERRNPFNLQHEGLAAPVPQTFFERNQHGHLVITFVGLDLTGNEEIKRLENAGYHLTGDTKFCFKSTGIGGYNKNHRLVAGQEYRIALVPGKEIARDFDRSTANLLKLGEKYGYGEPLGGHIPRIREVISDKQMRKMGFDKIVSLHSFIQNSNYYPSMFSVGHILSNNRYVSTHYGSFSTLWGGKGAFAFPCQ